MPLSTAPTQYLGFSLQVNRLLFRLLRAEVGDSVSLEVLGDVAVTSSAGAVRVEELKSRTSTAGNPVADRSVELWKTFRNWIDAVSSGHLDPQTTDFVLCTSRAFEGGFLRRLVAVHNEEEATAAIDAIRDEFWGEAPAFQSRSSIASALKPHLERILSPAGKEHMRRILPRFSYDHGSNLPEREMLAALRTKAVGEEVLQDVLMHLLGWVKFKTDELLSERKPACIPAADFYRELVAYARKVDRIHILASFAPPPATSSIEHHLATRLFVTQLDLIAATDEDKFAAVGDFLRAEADRIHWAARDLVHESTFNEFEVELCNIWRNYQTRGSIEHKDKADEDRGRLLLADCSLHKTNLQGSDVPAHFTRGCFHALADELTVGWHPKYRSLLRRRREE